MSTLFAFRDGAAPALRPVKGGADVLLNPRWRDVVIGQTKPDASTTGPYDESRLEKFIGNINPSEGEYWFEDLDILGNVVLSSTSTAIIHLYNCRVRNQTPPSSRSATIINRSPAGFIYATDCEVTNDSFTTSSNNINGFLGGRAHFLRCNFHDTVDLLNTYNPDSSNPTGLIDVTVEASWLHDFLYISPDANQPSDNATHNDGLQTAGGAGLVFRGNNVQMTQSVHSVVDVDAGGHPSDGAYGQGLTLTPTNAAITDLLSEYNWFDYGVAGSIIVGGSALITGTTLRGNRYGPNIDPSLKGDLAPIVVTAGVSLEGIGTGASGTTTVDTTNGNVDFDGNPVSIYWR